jgi:hypothetical protein
VKYCNEAGITLLSGPLQHDPTPQTKVFEHLVDSLKKIYMFKNKNFLLAKIFKLFTSAFTLAMMITIEQMKLKKFILNFLKKK